MIKKIICMIFGVFIITINSNYAKYDINNTDIVDTVVSYNICDRDSNSLITRRECITAIMKICGVSDETALRYQNANYITKVYNDVRDNNGFIVISKFNGISFGILSDDYGTYFAPDKVVTIDECIAFMTRCLSKDENSDLVTSFSTAKDIGLIYENDSFFDKEKELLSKDDFYLLLYRMMHQKRYKYYDVAVDEFVTDENRMISYIEFLETL